MFGRFIAVVFLCIYAQFSFAHDPGLSSVDLVVNEQGIDVTVTFSLQDIEAFVPMDADQDAEVTPSEQDAAKPKIALWVQQGVQLLAEGQVLQPVAAGVVSFDQQNNAHIAMQYRQIPTELRADFLNKLPKDHKQYVTVKDEVGKSLSEKMLSRDDSVMTSLAGKSSTFTDFLLLGIEHILTGYDHLLFLFSLLVVTRNFLPALKIITFFTIAHSITLALAAMNLVDIPSTIVEPLIAATIIYVGVENMIRGDHPTGRQWLTFFFGLIHGFGFAAVLREMGISSLETGILVPLFSFNLGVELGQITVAAIVLPIVWWLHKKPVIEPYLTPVCSVLASLAGTYWLIERTLLS